MKLYLVRHGEAEHNPIDAERPLSDRGVEQVTRLAVHFAEAGAQPAHIYHSGLLRAEQTAELIAQKLSIEEVEKINHLDPTDPIQPILAKIDNWEEDTVLVGHMPYMAELWAKLTKNYDIPGFQTATGVCFQRHEDLWTIEWIFHGCDRK